MQSETKYTKQDLETMRAWSLQRKIQVTQTRMFDEEFPPKLTTTGCDRTGCMYCMFGIMSDKEPNRFQRMKQTHPAQYKYCIYGGHFENGELKPDKTGLGLGKILDYIGKPY